ncbi:S-layer homology domain-containing protein [Paenibacillus anseongense]|uniref:S-layer homology domain-containing protein n=1 Tax=Paenibacillus TaxID=44249 RepID=UPI002DB8E893|nr:S-layer homology domain-containing protein [Paenibacillus anseongense]MEC0264768.1 S-layer homology domain-containing protein [Paenibacillus anseongense]
MLHSKKVVAAGLALVMMLGSGTAVMAEGYNKNKGKHDDDRKGNNKIELHLTFNDLKNSEWAMRYIASLASKRVFEGYDDGTFKPQNTVSRIEAITAAVRLMGLRDQAESPAKMSTKLNFKDANQIPAWAVGYVAVALENDLFSESDDMVNPQKVSDRLWATTLLVKALKLDADAKAKMNTVLPFTDAKQIPAGSVGYVAVARERGLVDGFEDNTFKPNQPVTRAQLAALLDRVGGQLPDQDNNSLTGTVNAAVTGSTLNLTRSGSTYSYALHPEVFVYRNGAKVNVSAIQVGDQVKLSLFNNQVVFIEVTTPVNSNPNTVLYNGTVSVPVTNNTLTITNGSQSSSMTLDPNVVVYRGGTRITAYDLRVGDVVSLSIANNQVTYISVTTSATPVTNSGTVSAIVNDNVLQLMKAGVNTTYTLDSNAVIYRNNVQVSRSALQIGDVVNISTSNNLVTYVQVTQMAQTLSTSATLNAAVSNNVLQVTSTNSSSPAYYTVSPDVVVYRNGVRATLSDLRTGDVVNLRTSNNQVIYIEVTRNAGVDQSFDIYGYLKSTTVNAQGVIATITISQNVNGTDQNTLYNVSPSVSLSGNLGLFSEGHLVELIGSNNLVTSIVVK